MEHQSRICFTVENEEYGKFALLKPELSIDGDQWICLYGRNIQEGIVGVGDTPYKAIMEWNRAWHKSINPPVKGEAV
jgi:hypothetical protein